MPEPWRQLLPDGTSVEIRRAYAILLTPDGFILQAPKPKPYKVPLQYCSGTAFYEVQTDEEGRPYIEQLDDEENPFAMVPA